MGVGTTDTIAIDITNIVGAWQSDSLAPRSLMLRVLPEGGNLAELRFGTSEHPTARPFLRITFVPPFRFQ